jgi:hypothetical protein
MAEEVRTFRGRCHCGALEAEFRTRLAPAAIPVRACQCGFCRRHGTATVADPDGSVRFIERERGALVRYRFGLHTADYLICARCGVYMGAGVVEGGGGFAIVNGPALDQRHAFSAEPRPVAYDHEDRAARLARRRAGWTPLAGPLPGADRAGADRAGR